MENADPAKKRARRPRRSGQSRKQKDALRKARQAQQDEADAEKENAQQPPPSPTKPYRDRIAILQARNTQLEVENAGLKKKLRLEQQKRRRRDAALLKAKEQQTALQKDVVPGLQRDMGALRAQLKAAFVEGETLRKRLLGWEGKVEAVRERLEKSQKEKWALRKRCKRAEGVLARAVARTRREAAKENSKFRVYNHGFYTRKARAMARFLISTGTSEKNVGKVIQTMGGMMGKSIDRVMSARTVQRVVAEGGLAAEMQVCQEIINTSDLTYSSDGTSHLHVEYVSRAMALKVDGKHALRTFGVNSTTDKSAKTQFDGLRDRLGQFSATWNNSPMAKRTGQVFHPEFFIAKLRGTSGDHAKDNKKQHNDFMREWKESVRNEALGSKKLKEMPAPEVVLLFMAEKEELIDKRGGVGVYMQMSKEEVKRLDEDVMRALSLSVKEELKQMKDERQIEYMRREMDRAAQVEEDSLAARTRHDDVKTDLSEILAQIRQQGKATEEQKHRCEEREVAKAERRTTKEKHDELFDEWRRDISQKMAECADDLSALKTEGASKAETDVDLVVEELQRQKRS